MTDQNEAEDGLFGVQETARLTNRDPALLRRWITQGTIPTIRRANDKRGTHLLDIDAIGKIMDMPRIGYRKVKMTTAVRMSDGTTKLLNIIQDVPIRKED